MSLQLRWLPTKPTGQGMVSEKRVQQGTSERVRKIVLLAVGYGTLALVVRFAADCVPKIKYLNRILLEPIVKYLLKARDV